MSLVDQEPLPPSWEGQVKRQIRRRYGRVSETGLDRGEGAARARRAGYPEAFLDRLPRPVIDAFCGCGNPLDGLDLSGVRVAVDLGCGAGIDTRLLAELLPPRCLVVGLDMTTGMAALANAGPIRTVVADMEGLPLADDVADLVLANASFNLTLDKPAAFAEARRVLKPGGRLAARDLIRQGDLPNEIMEDPLAWNTSLGGVLEEAELRDTLEAAGFSKVCISDRRPFPPVTSIKLEAVAPG
jgi:SAM-dependent methyltransferase